jgi:hypothetical protein
MNRRSFFKRLAKIPVWPIVCRYLPIPAKATDPLANPSARRVRPSDPSWPNAESWEKHRQAVGGNLIKVESPLAACESGSDSAACQAVIKNLQNPYFIGPNYSRLLQVKAKYDPTGLFFIHHGVGSEE